MNFTLKNIFVVFFLSLSFSAFSQTEFNLSASKSSKIKFKLINNVIILPVELNGVKLSFVLDTGVSRPILFNLVNMDSVQLRNTEQSFLRGLGSNGAVQAIKSKGNVIKIGEAIAVNKDVSVVFDPGINFTPRLGVPVHGIIGYDIFKDFIVELNYSSKFLRLHHYSNFKSNLKKYEMIPIDIIDRKPYLFAETTLNDNEITVKLLMDTGSSDALWLFENSKKNIKRPNDMYFDDFLGKGLSGSVYGVRSKVESLSIGSFKLDLVNVAFPDSSSLGIARNFKERNGSLSGNVLQRFNLFFDYKNGKLWIKKNSNFKTKFYYNNSGITLEQRGFRVVKERFKKNDFDAYRSGQNDGAQSVNVVETFKYALKPSFVVVELREDSNAKKAGIEIRDIFLTINGKDTSELSLQEVNKFFYDKKGKLLRVRVDRKGIIKFFKFKLDDVFKKKSLQNEDSN